LGNISNLLFLIVVFGLTFISCTKEKDDVSASISFFKEFKQVFIQDRPLIDLEFTENDVGFLLGDNVLHKSIDLGESWSEILILKTDTSTITQFITMDVFNENHLAVLAKDLDNNKSFLLYSNNGGLNWDTIHRDKIGFSNLTDISMISESEFILVGQNYFLRSSNSGASWDTVLTYDDIGSLGPTIFSDFVNSKVGFFMGDNSFLKTEDGGLNFIHLTPRGFILNLDFFNEDFGFTSHFNASFFTADGGQTWNKAINTDTNSGLEFHLDASIVNKNHVYLCSNSIDLSRDGGKTYSNILEFERVENAQYIPIKIHMLDISMGFVIARAELTATNEPLHVRYSLLKTTTGWE